MEENAKDGTDQVKSGWSDWVDSGHHSAIYYTDHRYPHRMSDKQAAACLPRYPVPMDDTEKPTTVQYVSGNTRISVIEPKGMKVTVVDLLEKLHLLEERQDRLFTELQELRKQMEDTHASGHSKK